MRRPKKSARPPMSPEELVARALCRGDPDAETPRGPLWTGYCRDAGRVVAALGGRLVGDDWTPTAAAINALPRPLRDYVMQLETHADPSLTLQEVAALRIQVGELEAMLLRERAEADNAKRPPAEPAGVSKPRRRRPAAG